jgi:hypothetical protein
MLNDLLTGVDGKTHDIARWSWMIVMLTLIAGAVFNAYSNKTVNLRDFADSVAIIVGAHGAAMFAKKDTEPKGESNGPPSPTTETRGHWTGGSRNFLWGLALRLKTQAG